MCLKGCLMLCEKFKFTDVVRVTGDCPFISSNIIEILIKNHKKKKADITLQKKLLPELMERFTN